MAQEVELKLAIAPADWRRFMAQPLLRDAPRIHDEMLDTTYFDTPDLDLRGHGVALRVRRIGRRKVQTVKLAAIASGGLSIRPEWETPYAGRFDFSPVDAPGIREWLERPEILSRLGPLFQTRFRRRTWRLPLAAGGEILVALDRGEILAGGRAAPISEVELELAGGGGPADLTTLADRLAQRMSLKPANLSKAQRGYLLLARSST